MGRPKKLFDGCTAPSDDRVTPSSQRVDRMARARYRGAEHQIVTFTEHAELVLRSPPDLRFDIQTSTNLTDWSQLMAVTNVSGSFAFTNSLITNVPRVFYRAKLLF